MPTSIEELCSALRAAYPSRDKLEQMVKFGLGENLNDVAAESGDLQETAFRLVTWAESSGKLGDLIEKAHKQNPGNPQLSALHAKHVGAVAAIPRVLPPRRIFVGRERELVQVEEALKKGNQGSITQASVWGLGGVGKTALALAYAHRVVDRRDCPGGVWWLVAEGKPLDVMLRLANMLRKRIPHVMAKVPEDAPPEEIVEELRLALEAQPQPCLLVLDNVDHDLSPYLPGGNVKVLLTTRDVGVSVGSEVKLDVLSKEDAKALATAIAGEPRDRREKAALARVVVEQLGALAVAVEVAAKAVKRWVPGWAAYEKHLLQSIDIVNRAKHRSEDYPAGVFGALDISIGKAGGSGESSPLARTRPCDCHPPARPKPPAYRVVWQQPEAHPCTAFPAMSQARLP